MADAGFAMVRYADDFVVLCRTPEQARHALEQIKAWTREVELTLHPGKTRIDVAALYPSGLLVPRSRSPFGRLWT